MNKHQDSQALPTSALPKGWSEKVKSSVLHLCSVARFTIAQINAQDSDDKDVSPHDVRIRQLEHQIQLLREQIRIMALRMERIAAQRRPRYSPIQRLQILELKAVCGWSLRQTARQFLIAPATIASWLKRVDEGGPDAIVKVPQPVNRFPDFVRYTVQRLKTLCPQLGKAKMAEILCCTGLHLATATVGRMLKEQPSPDDRNDANETEQKTGSEKPQSTSASPKTGPIVRAKHPNHVWHLDLTTVPIGGGFWTAWFPFTLPQCWPFCWWVAIVMDHFSRKVIGFAVFTKQPTSLQVRTFLGRAISRAKAVPKHLISDKGPQFWCDAYKRWCRRKKIKPRFGAIGKHGSIAVIERMIRTFKEFTRSLPVIPMIQSRFRTDCLHFFDWYNKHRPHQTLKGKTPDEVYVRIKHPANRRPRIEPRKDWPRGSPCAKPQTLVAGQPGDRFTIDVDFHHGHRHLPIVTLNRAA